MTRPPRGLSPDEAALWARVAGTVKPLKPRRNGEGDHTHHGSPLSLPSAAAQVRVKPQTLSTIRSAHAAPPRPKEAIRALDRHGLDSTWERKLAKGPLAPDFTIDLHEHTLDAAHRRLDHGLALALAEQARVVLVITGKPRGAQAADRGSQRGAIRAKLLDWLALGSHASRIAAVRPAHPRHGGAGAVYVVLRRPRV